MSSAMLAKTIISEMQVEIKECGESMDMKRAVLLLIDCERLADILRTYILSRKRPEHKGGKGD